MLQKESWTYLADNTNVKWVKIFQLYKGFKRKTTRIGFFSKGSCQVVEPPRVEYKGFKYKFSLKGDINKQLLVRSRYKTANPSGSTLQLNSNDSISIYKQSNIKSKYLSGASIRASKRKKINSLFTSSI